MLQTCASILASVLSLTVVNLRASPKGGGGVKGDGGGGGGGGRRRRRRSSTVDREKEADALKPLAVALAKLSTLQVSHRMIEQMRLHEHAGVALAEGAARFFPSTATRASLAAKEMASIRDSIAGAHRDAVVAGSRGCRPDAPLDLAHVILKEKVGSKLGLVCLYLEA